MSAVCLDEKTVLAFLGGTLPSDARDDVEAHLASCKACAETVTWAAADLANASQAPGQEGRPFLGQLTPGTRVDRYQILGPVGRGGMGEVYAAYHPDLDRRIALKVVYESGANSAERRARLLREARAIARLSHPNVIGVHDAGTIGDRVYIAMEFVDGDTLDVWLRAAPRSWREILDVFVAAARGLAAAHAGGIVHRDFKPQNLMIGRDGSVRVMDFGLASVVQEGLAEGAYAKETREAADASIDPDAISTKVTKTGAMLGTPAYMAPEQWRGEPTDVRADQFSFCVALHEALYGARPVLAHVEQPPNAASSGGPGRSEGTGARRKSAVPAWLRGVVLRGLAVDRQQRFDSMNQLLAALTRGRTQAQRHFTGIAVGVAATLMFLGAWRLSSARRFDCKPPGDRLAAAWSPGDPSDKRRQLLHSAVLASGHPEAAAIWEKLSSALDAYVGRWNAMYTETCEATHVRGEQSGEVLDLRMRCLNDNLDEVRALTDVLATADRSTLPRGLTAVSGLTPVDRCADVRVLRAAVPLPRDEKTLRAVLALQSSIKEIQAVHDVGRIRVALDQAVALRPKVEATRYQPLLAELLDLTGMTQELVDDPVESENTLRMSFVLAIQIGDDLVAAKSATNLIYVVGYREGRYDESNLWWAVANAFLDRLGKGHERLRAWAVQNQGAVFMRMGNYEQARDFFQRAVTLKETILGRDDPDIAVSLTSLGDALHELGQLQKALQTLDRAAAILVWSSDLLDRLFEIRGEVLLELGRYREARVAEEHVLKVWEMDRNTENWRVTYPLTALGKIELAIGNSTTAVSYFERALRLREESESDATLVAETRFGLAQSLWDGGSDRPLALSLARSAHEAFAANNRPRQLGQVNAWLAAHAKTPRRSSGEGPPRKRAPGSPPSSAMVPTTSSAGR